MTKKWLLFSLVSLVGAGALGASWVGADAHAHAPVVRTINLERGSVTYSIRATGNVSSEHNVRIAATVPGRVAEVSVKVGSLVEKRQNLIRLNTDTARLQILLDDAEARELDADIARQTHSLDALKKDYRAGGESLETVRQAEDQLKVTQVRRDKIVLRTQQSQLNLAEYSVTSPIDGVVTDINAQPGEVVQTGSTLITLVPAGSQEILAKVDQADAGEIRIGMPVRVSLDTDPDKWDQEKVVRIDPAIHKDGGADYLAVWVSLNPRSALKLRPNQQVDVRIMTSTRAGVNRLPLNAMVTKDGKASVWIIDNGKLRSVPIQTGMFGESYVEVLGGLQTGQQVAVLDNQTLKEGDAVSAAAPGAHP